MCKIRCHFRKILTNDCAKLNDCNHNSKFSYTFLFIPVNSYGVKVARVGCNGNVEAAIMPPSCVRCFIYYVLGVTVYAKLVITANIETSDSAFSCQFVAIRQLWNNRAKDMAPMLEFPTPSSNFALQ